MELYADDVLRIIAKQFGISVRDITIQVECGNPDTVPNFKVVIDSENYESVNDQTESAFLI